jgi:hypothetical protein
LSLARQEKMRVRITVKIVSLILKIAQAGVSFGAIALNMKTKCKI